MKGKKKAVDMFTLVSYECFTWIYNFGQSPLLVKLRNSIDDREWIRDREVPITVTERDTCRGKR